MLIDKIMMIAGILMILVGTAFSEEVYRAAGKPTDSSLLDLVNLVKEIKREPAQRDTFFNILRTF